MKILFISDGRGQDYMRDCVLHGLKSLFGPDVVDIERVDSMYKNSSVELASMYGRGFSLYKLLDEGLVDRTDIYAKIKNRFFDLVIWGSIHRCQDYLSEVASMYDHRRTCFIDGEDHPGFLSGLGGLTLKRELYSPQPNCFPIHFAIPEEKILPEPSLKTRLMAPCDPLSRKTYIYDTEASYYAQYAASYYAATMKKAGWDCLRHYEILSQWCLPYFRCLDQLPPLIAEHLPRPELRLAQVACEYFGKSDEHGASDLLIDLWHQLIPACMKALRTHMTTTALAKYVLSTIGVREKEASLART